MFIPGHESSKSSVLQDRVSPKPKRPEDSRQDKTKRPSTKDKISGQKSSQAKNQQDTKKPAKTTVASSVSSKVAGSAKNGERKSASGKATIDAPSQAVKSTKFQDLIQLAAQNSNPSKNPASKGGVSFPGKDKSASVLSSAALIRRKTAMERGGRSRSPAGLAVVRSECASRTPSPGLKSSGVKSPSGLKVSANSKTDSLKHKTKTGSAASGKSPNKDTKSNSGKLRSHRDSNPDSNSHYEQSSNPHTIHIISPVYTGILIQIGCVSNPDSDHLSHMDCDPDSNPDLGHGARVNAAIICGV